MIVAPTCSRVQQPIFSVWTSSIGVSKIWQWDSAGEANFCLFHITWFVNPYSGSILNRKDKFLPYNRKTIQHPPPFFFIFKFHIKNYLTQKVIILLKILGHVDNYYSYQSQTRAGKFDIIIFYSNIIKLIYYILYIVYF